MSGNHSKAGLMRNKGPEALVSLPGMRFVLAAEASGVIRRKLAEAAYKKGASALNKYILISNDGLGLSFAPLDTID